MSARLLAVALAAGLAQPVAAEEVTVFAAASLKNFPAPGGAYPDPLRDLLAK